MSRPIAALSFLFATGCAASLEGVWYGNCQFADDTYSYGSEVRASIDDGSGQRLAGKMDVDMADGRSFGGDLEGTRSDSAVSMTSSLQGDEDNSRFTFTVEGELQDDGSIEGTCALRLPGQTGAGLTGTIILEQP